MEIMKKQNRYLNEMKPISFINLGSLEGLFRQEIVQVGVGTKRKNPDNTVEATPPVSNNGAGVVEGVENNGTMTGSTVETTKDDDDIMEEDETKRHDGDNSDTADPPYNMQDDDEINKHGESEEGNRQYTGARTRKLLRDRRRIFGNDLILCWRWHTTL